MVLLRPCKTTAAYEAIPERELQLDLDRVEGALHARGWRTLANAGLMLVVQRGPDDASIFRSGKLLVKTRDADVARRVWEEIGPLYVEVNGHGR
jgi:TATA-box binding protein (TBP) (component of TFIID and TFIIIB)